jgi:succinate dehydrogenase/fumarate reductase flavoprotein subunit
LNGNFFRTGPRLAASLVTLDDAWRQLSDGPSGAAGDARTVLRARQAAAMTAHARWMYRSALARPESRGLHRRADAPDTDAAYAHRIITGGLDQAWTVTESAKVEAA